MTDDTIRAALEAATRTGCNCDCAKVQPGCRRQMADEIATFLNAPPPSAQTIRLYLGEVSSQGMRDIYAYHRWLAAAVEKAARHD